MQPSSAEAWNRFAHLCKRTRPAGQYLFYAV
jgi:hypothetical protein